MRRTDVETQKPDYLSRSLWQLGILLILLFLIPLYIFESDKTRTIDEYQNQLSRLADQKSGQIDNWLKQRYGDAALLQSNPLFTSLFQAPADEIKQYSSGVSAMFSLLERNMGYESLTAIRRDGSIIYSFGDPMISDELLSNLNKYYDTYLTWYSDKNHDLFLNLVVPVRNQNSYFIDGYVILNQSIKTELLPSIQTWTDNTTHSGFTLLLHTEGDDLVSIKIPPNSAWASEVKIEPFPDDRENLLRIAMSQSKETQRITTNEFDIIASYQPIGFTDFYILLQKDVSEILAPVYLNLYTLLGVLGGLFCVVIFLMVQHSRQAQFRYELQLERQTAEKDRLLRHFFELPLFGMTIMHAQSGRWIRINEYFCKLLGYSQDEMLKQNYESLLPKQNLESEKELFLSLESGKTDGLQRELQLIHHDGHLVDVNIDTRCVRHDNKISFFVNVIEDITQRKNSERALSKKNKLYNMLSHTNQSIVHSKTQEELFARVCKIAVEDGGFRIAFLAKCIHNNQDIDILEVYGDDIGFVSSITQQKKENPSLIPHTGIMLAISQKAPRVINNYQNTTITRPFHELAEEAQIRSSGYFPIYRDGRMFGVMAVYSDQVDFFDQNTQDTLIEMSGDISFSLDNMQRDEQLIKSERLFHNLTSFVQVGIFRLTKIGHLHYLNEFGQSLLKLQLPEQSSEWLSVFDGDALNHQSWLFQLLETGEGELECQIIRDGKVHSLILNATAEIEDNEIVGFIGTISDISRLKESEQELKHQAHYDSLTGLPNRTSLIQNLEAQINSPTSKGFSLLLVDLDRFKDVNDSFGHPMGNALLKEVTARLTQHMQDHDQVCRIGGDEFTIVLGNAPPTALVNAIAYDTIQLLKRPFRLPNGQDVILGASIGISRYPNDGVTSTELLQKADTAMYQAKQNGRNRYQYFTEDLSQFAQQRLEMEIRLKHAIEQKQFVAFYQPQVDMKTGEITGAEALIRWMDPKEGLIPPFKFIPLAEETGLIKPIGDWILKETCRQGKVWLDQGLPPLRLAVNISPVQFKFNDLLATIELTLNETGFPPHLLELEVTESVLMTRESDAIEILNKVRELGVRVAIDDFGTGYSSLSYLKKLPLDVLKIDKSFVDDIPHKKDDMEIATAIVGMAHTLRLKVLAEGVETIEQLEFLREQGCDFYQGYHKSKPVPADEFIKLWQNT